jgi:hypothetical protein
MEQLIRAAVAPLESHLERLEKELRATAGGAAARDRAEHANAVALAHQNATIGQHREATQLEECRL